MGRWVIRALVLGLHLLLLLGLQRAPQRANDKPLALPARINFFLLPLAHQAPKKTIENTRPPTKINRILDAALQKNAVAADAPVPATAAAAVPPLPPAAPADVASARLILTLPPWAASAPRNPALTDLRANTARLTLEEKMASALDNTVHLQVQADGTTVRRRVGNECVDLHESRAVQLMPDVEFLRFAPRTSGRAYKCK